MILYFRDFYFQFRCFYSWVSDNCIFGCYFDWCYIFYCCLFYQKLKKVNIKIYLVLINYYEVDLKFFKIFIFCFEI